MPWGYASSATLLLRCATRKVKSLFVCLLQIKTYILNLMITQWCSKKLRFACQKNSGSACKEFCSPLTHTLFQRYMSFWIQLFQRHHTVGHFDENDISRKRRKKTWTIKGKIYAFPVSWKGETGRDSSKELERQICLNMVDTSKLYVEVHNCISKCTFSLTKYYLSFPIPPTGLEVK